MRTRIQILGVAIGVLLSTTHWADALPGQINTYAGGDIGEQRPATDSILSQLSAADVDAAGNIYIADSWHHRIRKVGTDGIITTLAGTGVAGFSGDGGRAIDAQLNLPVDIAVGADGALYIADYWNHRIRRIDSAGQITTVAGGGALDEGLATLSRLVYPAGISFDSHGNLFIADHNSIRRLDTTGLMTTVAGKGDVDLEGIGLALTARLEFPQDVAVDASGSLYISEWGNHRIRVVRNGLISTVAGTGSQGFSGDGGLATSAALNGPRGIAIDRSGNLLIADSNNRRVRLVDQSGTIHTIAGTDCDPFYPDCVRGDGGPAKDAWLNLPFDVEVSRNGLILIADHYDRRVRAIDASGTITTLAGKGECGFAGDGGAAIAAGLCQPQGIALDPSNNLFIADTSNNRIRKVDPSGTISTVAGDGTRGSSGDGGPALEASLDYPHDVALDQSGNLFIADGTRVRKVDAAGTITTVLEAYWSPRGLAVDEHGNLFVSHYTGIVKLDTSGSVSNVAGTPGIGGASGDGGPAADALLFYPTDLDFDSAGNLYVLDSGNSRVRMIDGEGLISTVFIGGNELLSIAIDNSDHLLIGTHLHIFRVSESGERTAVAGNGYPVSSGDGGPATEAGLWLPYGMTVDPSGALFFSDTANHRIRKISG